MARISKRQKVVLAEISKFISLNNYSPSLRELSVALGRSSTVVHGQLVALRDNGWIEWEPDRPRTLRILMDMKIEDCSGQVLDIVYEDGTKRRFRAYGILDGSVRGFGAH